MSGSTAQHKVLRAKYHDWCSARLADSFLVLAPDEIYEMAERASHGHALERVVASGAIPAREVAAVGGPHADAAGVGLPTAETESFRALVALVTEVLAETLSLPTFEEWVVEYEKAPEKYEHELLGFWRESVE